MAKLKRGRNCFFDGEPAVVLSAPKKKTYKDGFSEWFVKVAIVSEAWDGEKYVPCRFDVRVPRERITT